MIKNIFLTTFVRLISFFSAIFSFGLVTIFFVLALVVPTLDDFSDDTTLALKIPLKVFTSDGKLIGEFGNERRIPINIVNAPPAMIDAILAAEDDGFFEHPGFDIKGIIRALLANLSSKQTKQGASTITMQVVKNYFLTPERTYARKLNELIMAFKLEKQFSKEKILELYINKIFLGHRAYGFAAASNVYYNRTLNELNLAEIAMLAGLPKAPSSLNPITNPQSARERRNYVLKRMLELSKISQVEYEQAITQEITAKKHKRKTEINAPYMAEMVRSHLFRLYGKTIYESGFRVYTTISSVLQQAGDDALRRGLVTYDRRHGYQKTNNNNVIHQNYGHLVAGIVQSVEKSSAKVKLVQSDEIIELNRKEIAWPLLKAGEKRLKANKISNYFQDQDEIYLEKTKTNWRLAQIPKVSGAFIALDPKTAQIKALSGGFDFKLSKFNRVIQASRQAGSNIKPFIYSAALEKGFRPNTKISAEPLAVRDDSLEDGIWKPGNYSGKFYGYTTLRNALSKSLNLVSVRLLNSIGIDFAIDHLSRFDFDANKLPRGLSLALGSADVTPIQLVSSYAVFANGGYRVKPYFIDYITNHGGETILRNIEGSVCYYCTTRASADSNYAVNEFPIKTSTSFAITSANAYIMDNMLKQVMRSGTGASSRSLGRNDLAGKTGTTNDFKDAWFSGYNLNLVATVWVGYDQPRTLGKRESATRVALPIWIDFMKIAISDVPQIQPQRPDNVRNNGTDLFIMNNIPEFEDKSLILDSIQTKTNDSAEGLF